MAKVYMFPGQGSQFPGMGKELYESNPKARELFEKANAILGFRITDIMFEGTAEDLKATRVTQPAVFLHSVITYLTSGLPKPDMVGGHSLGEFSALVACGALDFEDALRLVARRAEEMQKCCEAVPGTMAAIIALPNDTVRLICEEIARGNGPEKPARGIVVAANYNCKGQVVISGEAGAVEAACAELKAAGARRALPLAVSGAFHSPLMAPAAEALGEAIAAVDFKTPFCPIYQNVSARAETDPETIKSNLLRQLTSPVRWTQSVEAMAADGAVSFLEIGPGTVLQGLVRKILTDVTIEGIN
ncbi:MAG: ACP S-malonyltransferase [Bacteroidales bacterium]|nr:ACP S-malonyltransferase [Bacteroidales bacterium]